jgi:hypothetical protein
MYRLDGNRRLMPDANLVATRIQVRQPRARVDSHLREYDGLSDAPRIMPAKFHG